MNKIKKIILFVTLSICLIATLFDIFYKPEKVELPQTIKIINKTNYSLQFNTEYILHNHLGIDTIKIQYSNPEIILPEINSYTLKNILIDNHYIVFLTKSLSDEELKKELCIQMVYIQKYEIGELKIIDFSENIFEYKGELYNATNVYITKRPYDIEIRKEGTRLYNHIKKDLL